MPLLSGPLAPGVRLPDCRGWDDGKLSCVLGFSPVLGCSVSGLSPAEQVNQGLPPGGRWTCCFPPEAFGSSAQPLSSPLKLASAPRRQSQVPGSPLWTCLPSLPTLGPRVADPAVSLLAKACPSVFKHIFSSALGVVPHKQGPHALKFLFWYKIKILFWFNFVHPQMFN